MLSRPARSRRLSLSVGRQHTVRPNTRIIMHIREITEDDIPALFVVRVATHENQLTVEELVSLGITEETVKARLRGTFKGWLCEVNAQVVGFAMGDRATGELWVIALLPEYIGQGIGSALLRRVEDWLV